MFWTVEYSLVLSNVQCTPTEQNIAVFTCLCQKEDTWQRIMQKEDTWQRIMQKYN